MFNDDYDNDDVAYGVISTDDQASVTPDYCVMLFLLTKHFDIG